VTGWLLWRSGQALVTFLLATSLLFVIMRLSPGDPLARLDADRPLSPEAAAALRARYGLDQPIATQFARFVAGVSRGDLGSSLERGRPVTALLSERLPATLLLGGTALAVNFTLGIWLGAWQAARRGSRADRWLSVLSLAAYATPSFWLALVLAWAFGTELRILPVAFLQDPLLPADAGPLSRVLDVLRHLILPAATLSIVTLGATARYQRGAMIEALAQPFVRTARAKGLAEPAVRWRHAWPNALAPMLTLFGLWLPLLVAGSVFVEQVFAWPGVGTLATEAILARDYPVIMGVALLVSGAVVAGNLLADALHRLLDPRQAAAT
jgi:peptide/nickel transport system permease protein